MYVALVNYTPNPELLIAAAARSSASRLTMEELQQQMTPQQIDNLFKHTLQAGHLSPFEHASFTFSIQGISRVTSHQLVRHRIASYSQQSQRYVSAKTSGYVTPPTIASKANILASYKQAIENARQLYLQMLEAKIPAEDARFVLPQAVETQLVMTMNARELLNSCSLRLCLRAQWEILELFEKIKVEVTRVAPRLGVELKPKCYDLGYCNERESCGIFPVRDSSLK
jgi:thymidylate synthase (FAD)